MNKTLYCYIDESGNFSFENNAPKFYIVSFVFVEDKASAENNLSKFVQKKFHAEPIIHGREDYYQESIISRKQLFNRMAMLFYKENLFCKSFSFVKKEYSETIDLIKDIKTKLKEYFCKNYSLFKDYNRIILNYDGGQNELEKILKRLEKELISKINLSINTNGRCYEIADFCTSMELLKLKLENNCLTKSDAYFFTRKELKKLYLKDYQKKIKGD